MYEYFTEFHIDEVRQLCLLLKLWSDVTLFCYIEYWEISNKFLSAHVRCICNIEIKETA